MSMLDSAVKLISSNGFYLSIVKLNFRDEFFLSLEDYFFIFLISFTESFQKQNFGCEYL